MEQCTVRSWARFERAGKSDRDNVITHPPVPLRIPPNFFLDAVRHIHPQPNYTE
jgi:hypothetical protein